MKFLRKLFVARLMIRVPRTGSLFHAVFLIVALIPSVSVAQVVISEVMYDLHTGSDKGREWIEIRNAGSEEILLGTWKLFEDGVEHKITPVSGGDKIPPASYAVIVDNVAKFKIDLPQYGGILFDSAFSLSNSGEIISLRNASSTDIDIAEYQLSMGASGDGNSLNREKSGDIFVKRLPTPGSAMSATAHTPIPKAPIKVVSERKSTVPANAVIDEDEIVDIDEGATGVADVPTVPNSTEDPSPHNPGSPLVWWLGAFGISGFAALALFFARRFGRDEWNIEEMTEKG